MKRAARNGGSPGRVLALLVLGLLPALLAPAGAAWAAAASRRAALVIGNGAYQAAPTLPNPANDARELAKALRAAGFEVSVHVDLDATGMDRVRRQFARSSRGAGVALFFYAGHGLAVRGKNYLVPVDAKLEDEADLESETVALEAFTGALEAEERTSLIFLDACRDNPLAQRVARGLGASRSGAVRSGLAEVSAGAGTLIAYATQPDAVAADGEGRHSPFAEALLRHMPTPGLEVRQLMMRVRNDVLAATAKRQRPWEESALTAEFYFHQGPPAGASVPARPGPSVREEALWRGIADSRRADDFAHYLENYPEGVFATLARSRMAALTPSGTETRALPDGDGGPAAAVPAPAPVPPAPRVAAAKTPVAPPPAPAPAALDEEDGEFEVYTFEDED